MENIRLAKPLAWLELVFSILMAGSIIYGYLTYRSTLGDFLKSVATSIVSVSNVVQVTAETVQARQSFVDNSRQMITVTRSLITELNTAASNQVKQAPQHAQGIRALSSLSTKLGDSLSKIGDGLLFTVPTSIQMDGIRPVLVMSQPLAAQAQVLKTNAQEIKTISNSLLSASTTIANDGQKLGKAFEATCEQALKVLDETEKTIGKLHDADLPKALQDIKSTSESLRSISQEVNIVGNVGIALLIFGLLLSGWCFLNSVSLLMLVRQNSAVARNV